MYDKKRGKNVYEKHKNSYQKAKKLNFVLYLYLVIILFNTDLHKSLFYTYSFEK